MKMKVNRTAQSCLLRATLLLCLSYLGNASDEDLMDFDFTDLKEIDWNYDMSGNETTGGTTTANDNWRGQGHGHGALTLDDDDMSENQVHPFDWREKILRTALSKALTNKSLRQKFVEVMPILRVLSKQQRLALSALISAQVNAKKGQELKLEQVRMMFGDDKKLLIPIVYDIARLVGESARKYLQFSYELLPMPHQQRQQAQRRQQHQKLTETPINRRKFDLDDVEELSDDDGDVGTLPSGAMPAVQSAVESSLEDFFGEIPDDVLDPQSINEALQASAEKSKAKANLAQTTAKTKRSLQSKRARREAQNGAKEFVHKLMRSIPLSVNEEDLQQGVAGRTVKLNTTSFVLPSVGHETSTLPAATNAEPISATSSTSQLPSYHEIEDLAFASLNGTEIHLEGNAENGAAEIAEPQNEPLPSPEELIAGPRYRINNNKVRIIRPKLPPIVAKRKRVQVLQQQPQQSRPYIRPKGVLPTGPQAAAAAALVPAPRKCERFTASMCIRTDDYPLDQIMGSIRRHKNAMTALLAEFHDKPLNLDFSDEFDEFGYNKRRREDEGGAAGSSSSASGGSMCQSIVRYARPQKARSASGEWKYIVNTGQHTQTLRLEKCSNPQESCSYLAQNYRSHCSQVYNYHRLLSWDKTRGLHVDIFKVPTCCSCQIDGYRQQFPPLDTIKSKEFTPAYSPEPYSTINEELDYNDDEDEDDLSFQYAHNYQHHKKDNSRHAYESHATNELQLGSQSVRTKVHAPNPTVGSYLTPPGSNEYDTNYAYKGSGSNHHQYHQHQQQHPHQHRTAVTASVTTSSKSAYSQLPRRRPYKSLGHSYDGESRADLEIAPSEVHTDKEVNVYGNDKTRQVQQQKRKRIYSVPHTATTSSLSSSSSSGGSGGGGDNSPIITSAGVSTSSVPPHRLGSGHGAHGHGFGHDSHHGHGEHGKAGGATAPAITTITTTHQASAASPSYYTPGAGKNVIRSGGGNYGKSKPRYRATQPTPHTAQTQRTAYASAIAPASSSASSTPVSPAFAASLPATEHGPQQYATTPASSDAAFPSIYHISSIFNNSVPIGGTKRINYSYHPIIDFFESGSSNNKRHRAATTRTAPSAATTTTYTATGERGEHNGGGGGGTRTTFSVHDQIISHKIPKYSSVINKKLPATAVSTAVDVNGLLQYRERRIGMGAGSVAADDIGGDSGAGAGTGGSGNGVGFGFGVVERDGNTSQGDDIVTGNDIRASAGSADNVWHPMLVQ